MRFLNVENLFMLQRKELVKTYFKITVIYTAYVKDWPLITDQLVKDWPLTSW